VVIRAGLLLDGTGAQPSADAALILAGTTIEQIVPWAESLRDGATLHDFGDATALPGLVDAHCHLMLGGTGLTYEQDVASSDEFLALRAVHNAQVALRAGITTLRDNGARNRVTFTARDAIEGGLFTGPRLLLSGRPLTPTGGHFHFCNGVADGEDEIRREIRRLVLDGADHIKIMVSGGLTEGSNPALPSYTAAELKAAVELAHDYGRLTTAHCRATRSIDRAVEAGLDCVEHAPRASGVDSARGARCDQPVALGRRGCPPSG
jgi:imidazolonepropionase-like amidohydrolase